MVLISAFLVPKIIFLVSPVAKCKKVENHCFRASCVQGHSLAFLHAGLFPGMLRYLPELQRTCRMTINLARSLLVLWCHLAFCSQITIYDSSFNGIKCSDYPISQASVCCHRNVSTSTVLKQLKIIPKV